MKRFLKSFKFTISFFIVGIISLTVVHHYDYSVSAPGIVIAKNTEMETRRHVINDVYRVAIRPDNSNYPVYDVKVSFAKYVSLQKGQRTFFNIRNPEMSSSDNFIYVLCVFLLILSLIGFIIAFITELINLH